MGFLDKLKVKKKDAPAVPPPPPQPEGGLPDSKPEEALAPLPTTQQAQAPSEQPPAPAPGEQQTPMPVPDAPPAPDDIPTLDTTQQEAEQVPNEQVPPAPAVSPMPAESSAPQQEQSAEQEETVSEPEESTQSTSFESMKVPPPAPAVPPPPAPASRASRKDVREQFGDMPPIKVDPKDAHGMITSDQVEDLDVERFRLPESEQEKPFTTSSSSQDPATKQPAPGPSPSPIGGAPMANPIPKGFDAPEMPGNMDEPHEHPFSDSPVQNSNDPLPQPSQDPAPSVFTGPLYVDIKTYESMQATLSELKKELDGIGTDVDDILKIKEKEDSDFSDIVARLEKVQDELLRIDEDLFEQ